MIDRKLRYTLSAAAWVGALICALGLLASATVVASAPDQRPGITSLSGAPQP